MKFKYIVLIEDTATGKLSAFRTEEREQLSICAALGEIELMGFKPKGKSKVDEQAAGPEHPGGRENDERR